MQWRELAVLLISSAANWFQPGSARGEDSGFSLHKRLPNMLMLAMEQYAATYIATPLLLTVNIDAISRQSEGSTLVGFMAGAGAGDGDWRAKANSQTMALVKEISQRYFEGTAGQWAACFTRYVEALFDAGHADVGRAMLAHMAHVLVLAEKGCNTHRSSGPEGGSASNWIEYDRIKRVSFDSGEPVTPESLLALSRFCTKVWETANDTVMARGGGLAQHPGAEAALEVRRPRGQAPQFAFGKAERRPPVSPGRAGASTEASGRKKPEQQKRRGLCWAFQKGTQCTIEPCVFEHACRVCGSAAHGADKHPAAAAEKKDAGSG